MECMAQVIRLDIFVDTADAEDQPRQMSVSARLEAALADGRRVVLLDDRGWGGRRNDGGDPWEYQTVEDVKRVARDVVGPDEPYEGHSQADMEVAHWSALAETLRREGVEVSGADLAAVPHEVQVSHRVMTRIPQHRP